MKITINFGGLITILLIILKLTGVITISWWLVLFLVWLPIAVSLAVIAFCALFIIISVIIALIHEMFN